MSDYEAISQVRRRMLGSPMLLAAALPHRTFAASPSQASYAASIADWGARGGNAQGDAAAIQRAFDEAPIGADLHFPPGEYLLTHPLRLTRRLNLIGNGAYLSAGFAGESLLTINIEDRLNRDNRNQRINGLRISMGRGDGAALKVTNQAPNIANIGLVIENNVLVGPAGGKGTALQLEGIGTHHLVIRANQIENGIRLNTADGVTIEGCLIFGVKPAITLDLIPGAFQTRIIRNGLVARDGALLVLNGSQIYFEHNTIEQFPGYGSSQSKYKAHITIDPTAYGSRHVHIVANNFGGGDNAGAAIYVAGNCRDLFIDRNVFNVNGAGTDVVLAGPQVGWTRIGPTNSVRGPGERRPHLLRGDPLAVDDRGTGTYGVRVTNAIKPMPRWRLADEVAVFKSLENVLRFEGAVAGEGPAGGVIAQLREGLRPSADFTVLAIGDGDAALPVRFEATGVVRLLTAFSGRIGLDGLAIAAALPPAPAADDL